MTHLQPLLEWVSSCQLKFVLASSFSHFQGQMFEFINAEINLFFASKEKMAFV
jgi:hypothetical protein